MEKKKVAPKVKNLLMSTMLITAEQTSSLLLSPNSQAGMKNIQTVVAVGPHIKPENGYDIKPGDKVLLNIEGLMQEVKPGEWRQTRPIGQAVAFDDTTGEFCGYDADEKKNQTQYYLIDSRRVMFVVE